jgi:hypothetical protein
MSGKITRLAFQQLIAEDIAWLEAQPRTLEREHVIECVREAERYYYDQAQDEAIHAARLKALRPLEEWEQAWLKKKLGFHPDLQAVVDTFINELLERRQGHP